MSSIGMLVVSQAVACTVGVLRRPDPARSPNRSRRRSMASDQRRQWLTLMEGRSCAGSGSRRNRPVC